MQSLPSHSSSFRAIVIPAARRAQATLMAFVCGALVFFIFEASKSAVFPQLTIWESHSITIVFGAFIAAGAAFIAMQRQAAMVGTLAAEEAIRERLESRQRALLESESRYRLLVETSPEAIAVHRGGFLVYVNTAGASLIGATSTDVLVGRRTADFVHRDDLAAV